jgi:hypothetical protein
MHAHTPSTPTHQERVRARERVVRPERRALVHVQRIVKRRRGEAVVQGDRKEAAVAPLWALVAVVDGALREAGVEHLADPTLLREPVHLLLGCGYGVVWCGVVWCGVGCCCVEVRDVRWFDGRLVKSKKGGREGRTNTEGRRAPSFLHTYQRVRGQVDPVGARLKVLPVLEGHGGVRLV